MQKSKRARRMSTSQATKSFHQIDLELGEDLTLPNTHKRHTIGTLKPGESKINKNV